MQTLALNDDWDLKVDTAGNIAVIKDDDAIAQSAANAVRLFKNDAYFNRKDGIPHFEIELEKNFGLTESMLYNRIRSAVMAVDGVTDCEIEFEYGDERILGGTIYITSENGRAEISI